MGGEDQSLLGTTDKIDLHLNNSKGLWHANFEIYILTSFEWNTITHSHSYT